MFLRLLLLLTPAAFMIALVALLTDCLTGSISSRAYIAVVLGFLWFKLLPMITNDAPVFACQLPNVLRKS
jgi:uncharacterized membrane protein